MPIYEYECCSCCDKFERLVFRSDESVSCPKCESENVQRVMSVCGFKSGGGCGDNGDRSAAAPRPASSRSSCAGCSGRSCSTCH